MIQILPEHIIDQIKAGEVIENVSSLLKELLENSIDAQSSRIDLELIGNGLELISVTDNGHGMSFEELPLAFTRHATSKLKNFEDLYSLSSFGFRGEALPSMAAVSRMTCHSTPRSDALSTGGKIEIHGSQIIEHTQTQNTASGTAIFVKNLFYNVPVRLKFLKSQTNEKSQIIRIIMAFLLAHPTVEFSIKFDDEEKIFFPAKAKGEHLLRIKDAMKWIRRDQLDFIILNNSFDHHSIWGIVGLDTGGSAKSQFLFANHRLFTDYALHQAIIQSMQSLWADKRGSYAIFLEIPPTKIDINIHPQKTEIKFMEASIVYSLVRASIKKALQEVPEKNVVLKNNINNQHVPPLSSKWKTSSSYQDGHASTTLSFFLPITDHLYLAKFTFFSSNYFLINLELFFKSYLIACWPTLQNLSEQAILPLLIARPFSKKRATEETLQNLISHGIELEELNDSTLVLRSIPEIWSNLPYEIFIEGLLSINEGIKLEINQWQQTRQFSDYLLTPEIFEMSLATILSTNHLSSLNPSQQPWLKPISDGQWLDIWNKASK